MVYLAKFENQIATLVKPSNAYGLKYDASVKNFTFAQRGNGGESITFDFPVDDGSLQLGKIYQVYMDKQLTQLLPCTFILTGLTKIRAGDQFFYQCEGIGASDLLNRKFLAPNYKNIKLKPLLEKLITETKLYVSELSDDFQYIQDIDYTFLVFKDYKKYAGELIQNIRDLGYTIYLRPDLKLAAFEKTEQINFEVDFYRGKINNKIDVVLENSTAGLTYPATPITSLIVTGGLAESGTEKSLNIIGTGEPLTGRLYDLEGEVNTEENYLLQEFNSLILENTTVIEQTGLGWDKRYAIYDLPFISTVDYFETQIKMQVRQPTGRSYVMSMNSGNDLVDTSQIAGWLIEDKKIKTIVNGIYLNEFTSKPFKQVAITSKSDDLLTFGVSDATGLSIGDTVSIAGLSTTLNATAVQITAISGNDVTISEPAIDGAITNALLTRVENYILKTVIKNQTTAEFWYKRESDPWVLLTSSPVSIPDDFFITIYNNQSGTSAAVAENGIYEIDNLALDYWFVDKGKFINLYDSNLNKKTLVPQDYFPTVEADGVINKLEKNGKTYSQVEFISPSLTPVVFNNSGTLSRIPVVLNKDAFVKNGMRVLFRQKAYTITDFLISQTGGYIDVTPNLDAIPVVQEPVYINTTIPALNETLTLDYVQADRLIVRECATGACLSSYGFREGVIDAPEATSLKVLTETSKNLIDEECRPIVSGTLGLIMGSNCKNWDKRIVNYFQLPSVGEYIKVSDINQGFTNEITPIQALQIQTDRTLAENINITIDFGREKTTAPQAVIKLLRKFGIFRGESTSQDDVNIYIPCLLRDTITLNEILTVSSQIGYDFLSGLYKFNFSGGQDFTEPIETLTISSQTGYSFLSGLFAFNFSGSQDIQLLTTEDDTALTTESSEDIVI